MDRTKLIGIKYIKQKYGVGRLVAAKIIRILPHVQIGPRRVAFAGDVDDFFQRAMESKVNLSRYIRETLNREAGGNSGEE